MSFSSCKKRFQPQKFRSLWRVMSYFAKGNFRNRLFRGSNIVFRVKIKFIFWKNIFMNIFERFLASLTACTLHLPAYLPAHCTVFCLRPSRQGPRKVQQSEWIQDPGACPPRVARLVSGRLPGPPRPPGAPPAPTLHSPAPSGLGAWGQGATPPRTIRPRRW